MYDALLEDARQEELDIQRHFADFVEAQDAARSRVRAPALPSREAPVKAPGTWPNNSLPNSSFVTAPAIECDEGTAGGFSATRMDGTCEEFLADAGLPSISSEVTSSVSAARRGYFDRRAEGVAFADDPSAGFPSAGPTRDYRSTTNRPPTLFGKTSAAPRISPSSSSGHDIAIAHRLGKAGGDAVQEAGTREFRRPTVHSPLANGLAQPSPFRQRHVVVIDGPALAIDNQKAVAGMIVVGGSDKGFQEP